MVEADSTSNPLCLLAVKEICCHAAKLFPALMMTPMEQAKDNRLVRNLKDHGAERERSGRDLVLIGELLAVAALLVFLLVLVGFRILSLASASG